MVSDNKSGYIIYCVMGDKWGVAVNVHVEFNGPVVVKVREGGWRICHSGG